MEGGVVGVMVAHFFDIHRESFRVRDDVYGSLFVSGFRMCRMS